MAEAITAELFDAGQLDADVGRAKLVQGPRGEPGAVYVPSVTGGVISWTNDAGLENPEPADISGPRGEKGDTGAQGPKGDRGDTGAAGPAGTAFVPSVDALGNLSWSNDGGLQNPATVNIKGPQGEDGQTGPKGDAGAVFTPSVSALGDLSWSNDGGLTNPPTVNIRGPQGEQGAQGPAGPKGDTGSGLDILGQYDSLEALQAAVTSPGIGDNYYVGESAPYDIYTWTESGGTPGWINGGPLQGAPGADGAPGQPGADGTTFTPSVDASGNLTWTNDGGLPNPAAVNIKGPKGDAGADGAPGAAGSDGVDGGYYSPTVNSDTGAISWTASKAGMPSVAGANIKGPAGSDGAPGVDGGYYSPSVDSAGNLTWTASKSGMPGVASANIKGADGAPGSPGAAATINGVNALTLTAGDNVEIEQSGSTVTISAKQVVYVTISGSGSDMTADMTCAEIYTEYQAGKAVYAVWQNSIIPLFQSTESSAYFSFMANTQGGYVMITSFGSSTYIYGETFQLAANSVEYDDSDTNLGANSVQQAIEKLAARLDALA